MCSGGLGLLGDGVTTGIGLPAIGGFVRPFLTSLVGVLFVLIDAQFGICGITGVRDNNWDG